VVSGFVETIFYFYLSLFLAGTFSSSFFQCLNSHSVLKSYRKQTEKERERCFARLFLLCKITIAEIGVGGRQQDGQAIMRNTFFA
jgi:hypothetical protein